MNALKLEVLKKFGTQFDFAQEADEHFSYVSMVLNRRRQLTGERAERWAEILGVGLDVLEPFMTDPRKARKGEN